MISIGLTELALSKTILPETVPVQPALAFELGSSISVAVPSVGSQSLTAFISRISSEILLRIYYLIH